MVLIVLNFNLSIDVNKWIFLSFWKNMIVFRFDKDIFLEYGITFQSLPSNLVWTFLLYWLAKNQKWFSWLGLTANCLSFLSNLGLLNNEMSVYSCLILKKVSACSPEATQTGRTGMVSTYSFSKLFNDGPGIGIDYFYQTKYYNFKISLLMYNLNHPLY